MIKERDWTVLFIGGASGTGKSSAAYELAQQYGINVIEIDDIFEAIKEMTAKEAYPMVHYWSSGINWVDIGVEGNVKWLINVSKEIIPAISAIVNNHIESNVPVIIEGDFLNPEFTISFNNPKVKSIFVYEPDKNQIVNNYLSREGGKLQSYRADCSIGYGEWLVKECNKLKINVVKSRPWNTVTERIINIL